VARLILFITMHDSSDKVVTANLPFLVK